MLQDFSLSNVALNEIAYQKQIFNQVCNDEIYMVVSEVTFGKVHVQFSYNFGYMIA